MVSWKDLGAGLAAVPRVAMRPGYWREVLRRLLFSRVFVTYAAVAGLLVVAGVLLAGGGQRGAGGVAAAALMFGPGLVMVALALLLPYGVWAFNPPVGRVLRREGRLPFAAEEPDEPPYLHYLLWAVPILGLTVLFGVLLSLPVFGEGLLADAYVYGAIVLLALATLKLYARGALAAHYERDDVDAFLAATRLQRLLVWVPLSLALGWGLVEGFGLAAQALALPPAWFLSAAPAALGLLAGLALVIVLAGLGCVATLLLACERMATPPEDAVSSMTLVMPSRLGRRSRPKAAARRRPSRKGRVAAVAILLLLVPGAAYLARAPLLDWYLDGRGTSYSVAVEAVNHHFRAQGSALDASRREDRLLAGYVIENCLGHQPQARWLAQVVKPSAQHQDWMLTCAACNGPRGTAEKLLVEMSAVPRTASAVPSHADSRKPRTALSCAATVNDLGLAQQLLPAQRRGMAVRGSHSALQAAIERGYWPMARLLARTATDDRELQHAVLTALERAHERGGADPAALLAGLRLAGLPLEVNDAQGRNLFHYAALWQDLPLARALLQQNLPAAFGPTQPDAQGALPWTYVQRKAQQDGQPLAEDAAELVRLLLPEGETLTIGP